MSAPKRPALKAGTNGSPRTRPTNTNTRSRSTRRIEESPAHSAFEQIEILYQEELYEEAIALYNIVNAQKSSSPSLRESNNEILSNVYIADSYFHVNKYNKSAQMYHRALSMFTPATRMPNWPKRMTEAEVRYRYHQCLLKLKKYECAYDVLAKIPTRSAPAKVKYAMMKLLESSWEWKSRNGLANKHTVPVLKREIIKLCPGAVSLTGDMLAYHNNDLPEIEISTVKGLSGDMVNKWLIAQDSLGKNDISGALRILNDINPKSAAILAQIGRLYHSIGIRNEATKYLQMAFEADPYHTDGMDLLAHLITNVEERPREMLKFLEEMSQKMMDNNPQAPETWTVMALQARVERNDEERERVLQERNKRILYFATHATELAVRGTSQFSYAMLAKAIILDEFSGSRHDAIVHFKDALKLDPTNFDLNLALIGVYIVNNEFREARNIANGFLLNSYSKMDKAINAHAKYLKAFTIDKISSTNTSTEEVCNLLEEVIVENVVHLDAVFLLCSVYDRLQQYEKAIELLRNVTEKNYIPYSEMKNIHKMLGTILIEAGHPVEAFNHLVSGMALGAEVMSSTLQDVELLLRQQDEQSAPSQAISVPQRTPRSPKCPPAPGKRRTTRSRAAAAAAAGSSASDSDGTVREGEQMDIDDMTF